MKHENSWGGIILILLGVLFLLETLDLVEDVWRFWPLVLIALGVNLLLKNRSKKDELAPPDPPDGPDAPLAPPPV